MKVLIAEWHEEKTISAGTSLRDAGFTVLVSADAMQTIKIARVKQPDVILLGLFSEESSVFETGRLLSGDALCYTIPIIHFNTSVKNVHTFYEAGVSDFIAYPFNERELIARVRVYAALKKAVEVLKGTDEKEQYLRLHFEGELNSIRNSERGAVDETAGKFLLERSELYTKKLLPFSEYKKSNSADEKEHKRLPESGCHKRKVVIVDDNRLNQEVIAAMLKADLDIESDYAFNEEGLMRLLDEASGNYLAVLMDVQLNNESGFDITKRMRHSPHAAIPVIGVSGKDQKEVIVQCKESGMNAYLQKPVSALLLGNTLRKFMAIEQLNRTLKVEQMEQEEESDVINCKRAEELAGGNKDLLNKWISDFTELLKSGSDCIHLALSTKSLARENKCFHNLLGLSSYFGADKLKSELNTLYQLIRVETNKHEQLVVSDEIKNQLERLKLQVEIATRAVLQNR